MLPCPHRAQAYTHSPCESPHCGETVSTEEQRDTHRGETALLLPDDGPEAQEASCHDKSTSEDEDVGRGSECAGGQNAEVAALLHQCPDTHGHDSCPTYLQRHKGDQVAPEALPAATCLVPTGHQTLFSHLVN